MAQEEAAPSGRRQGDVASAVAAARELTTAAAGVAAEAVVGPPIHMRQGQRPASAPLPSVTSADVTSLRQRQLLRRLSAAAGQLAGSLPSPETGGRAATSTLKQWLLGLAAVAMVQSRALASLAAVALLLVVVAMVLVVLAKEAAAAVGTGLVWVLEAARLPETPERSKKRDIV